MVVQVTEKTVNGTTYRNIKFQDIDYGTSIKIRLCFDEPRSVQNTKFPNKDGSPKTNYVYKLEVLEPPLGEVSAFAPNHLHKDLSAYKQDDILTLTAVEKKIEVKGPEGTTRKVSFKGYDVKSQEISLTEEDAQAIVDTIKGLPQRPTDDEIRTRLAGFGVTNPADVDSILKRV